MQREIKNVLPLQAELAECPTWSVREQVLWFVDILAPAVYRFDPASGALQRFPQREEVGCIGVREQGGVIAAMRSGVWLLDAQGQPQRKVADNPGVAEKSRFNDGRVDPWGNFWCGSLWEPQDKEGALLCRVTPELQMEVKAGDIKISNGLAFSPDRRWMYHSDTPHGLLYRYPLDAQGEPGEREIFRRFDANGGAPDGAAVDSEGYYWSAQFDGGRIVRVDPQTAEIVDEIALPVRWPTMVAFGGKDLKTLYITSSREDRTEEELARYPQSGDIFSVEVDVAGLAEPYFPA